MSNPIQLLFCSLIKSDHQTIFVEIKEEQRSGKKFLQITESVLAHPASASKKKLTKIQVDQCNVENLVNALHDARKILESN